MIVLWKNCQQRGGSGYQCQWPEKKFGQSIEVFMGGLLEKGETIIDRLNGGRAKLSGDWGN